MRLVIFMISLLAPGFVIGQEEADGNERDFDRKGSDIVMFSAGYAPQFPIGELADRFGFTNNISGNLHYKKGNWMIGAQGSFLVGSAVKEDNIINHLLTAQEKGLIDNTGTLRPVQLAQRGALAFAKVGYLFPLNNKNDDSGLMLEGGVGMMQHKIEIDTDKQDIPALANGLDNGYNRLSRGLAFQQFIGYLWLKESRFINLYIGLEMAQGITAGVYPWQFDTNSPSESGRFDMYVGFKLGWVIPKFLDPTQEFYFN